ncbi:Stringent starvation protein A [Andreprevotia sp. IGB-42]|uniref:glutathione S-transferase family protein n=1 Tax=Andreprevotia sp. IGB-42 TaxID=2497473 RepID=UPI00135C3A1B|nr:glutathione S-transferase family protein [Andreprevotia sp. IGB-42]KAF0813803.1 Stringent starvation protein A [Andreprevotia sp. IGB-42]
MQLIIGNKKYSSWSLRPWLALTHAGIPFEERLINLYDAGSRELRLTITPTGKVPALVDGDLVIWETLAIAEYLAEKYPQAQLWPADAKARAVARAACAEMHAGFVPLRSLCNMDLSQRKQIEVPADVQADVDRIVALWADCRARFGQGGPFLFGAFSWADAFFAPVATRFRTYGIALPADAQAYADLLLGLPAFKAWEAAGLAEPWSDQ